MSYCNRCGARLVRPAADEEVAVVSQTPQAVGRPTAAGAWAMAAAVSIITIIGLGLAFSMVMVFVERGLSLDEGRLAVIMATLVSVLLIDWLLLRQFTRLTSGKAQPADDAPAKPEKRKLFEKTTAAVPQLAAPREPVASVTENTTRTFDPVYRDRGTKS